MCLRSEAYVCLCVCVCVCVFVFVCAYLYRCCSRASRVDLFIFGRLSMKVEYFFTRCLSSFSSTKKRKRNTHHLIHSMPRDTTNHTMRRGPRHTRVTLSFLRFLCKANASVFFFISHNEIVPPPPLKTLNVVEPQTSPDYSHTPLLL